MKAPFLRTLDRAAALATRQTAVGPETLATAGRIIDEVLAGGRESLLDLCRRFDDLGPGEQLIFGPDDLRAALRRLPTSQVDLLQRTADRIAAFAEAQRAALRDEETTVIGGRAGWRYHPVARAGCYAPGGRFPLPSSVLMTAVTARVAGASAVWVASPRPVDLTLAAAAIAGADAVLAAGGAQAIAAMAYGVEGVPACEVIVGPGNRYVTAAKQLVSGRVGIDMLAGPSELVILADETAPPALIAADLLGQAEHDPEAVPLLVTTAPELLPVVEQELATQLADLATAGIAARALENGGVLVARDLDEAVGLCNDLAPEHLEVLMARPEQIACELRNYGALFLGVGTAEVIGDYGAGPNHVLPTGGTARFTGGLSVRDFLVCRTWLQMDGSVAAADVARDAVALARLEGLVGHARAAKMRLAE